MINKYHHDGVTVTFRGNADPLVAGSSSPDFARQLRSVVGDGIIVCPTYDHSGKIITITQDRLKEPTIINEPGDAFIILLPADYSGKIHGVVRTRDCGNFTGIIQQDNLWAIFGIHSSSQTEFGYQAFDIHGKPTCEIGFDGPITRRVLGLLRQFYQFNLKKCRIYVGPSLGGFATGCDCYEFTPKDGIKLCQDITRAYPNIPLDGLVGQRVDADKMTFRMGTFMQEVFRIYDIPQRNIHTESNLCTLCSPGHHSDRHSRHTISERSERPNNLAIITVNDH